jgi:glycosyltransferase involved in cell wall biosynthesis
MPKVSVIVPTYNRKDLVVETVESALHQNLSDVEIVVVDDGSVDGTREVLSSRFGDQIVYIYQTNRGRSAARNRGITESTGEYVVFLDSDDLLLPNALEVQSLFLDTHPAVGVAYTDGYYCDEVGRDLEPISKTRPPLRGRNMLETLVLDNVIIAPHSAMVRRHCLDRLGAPFFDENLSVGEDSDFWIRLAHLGCLFEYHDVVTCKYRVHGANTYAAGSHRQHIQAFQRSLHKIFNSDYFPGLSHDVQRAFFDAYLSRYLMIDTDSEQQLLDAGNFGLMCGENQAMVLYFIGVKNIIDEGAVEVGRRRLKRALALAPRWKYRIVYWTSHLGQVALRVMIISRRKIGAMFRKQSPVSPVFARLLEYWRQDSAGI